ncbi:hypothetical protein AAAC51_04955 [Priestia megaterium]
MISPYRTDSSGMLSIYHFIFIFHMPVFILLAGYFSKIFIKRLLQKNIYKGGSSLLSFPNYLYPLL